MGVLCGLGPATRSNPVQGRVRVPTFSRRFCFAMRNTKPVTNPGVTVEGRTRQQT
jgi:hypothetical protein